MCCSCLRPRPPPQHICVPSHHNDLEHAQFRPQSDPDHLLRQAETRRVTFQPPLACLSLELFAYIPGPCSHDDRVNSKQAGITPEYLLLSYLSVQV